MIPTLIPVISLTAIGLLISMGPFLHPLAALTDVEFEPGGDL